MKLWFKSRYVAHLEAEIERLRVELRRWQDALLTHDGLPRLERAVEQKPMPQVKGRPLPSQWKRQMELQSMPVDTEKKQ